MSAASGPHLQGHGVTADPRRCACGAPLARVHKLPGTTVDKLCTASGYLVQTRSAAVSAEYLNGAVPAE